MQIQGITSNYPVVDAQETSTGGGSTVGKDQFLQLLVAQLSNQDPLNPQDGAAFVAQLAQFSSLEQLISIREALETQNELFQELSQMGAQSAAARNQTSRMFSEDSEVISNTDLTV